MIDIFTILLIGKQIKERREQLRFTQADISEKTGICVRSIKILESGKGNPTLKQLMKVLDALEMDLNIVVKN